MARAMAGIDVGGTFTDLVLLEAVEGGPARVRVAKTPTTPENQAFGVMHAIAEAGIAPAAIDLVLHGTTTTTNAVLEGKIARVGLITTKGFRDILELGRRTRPAAYGMRGTFEPLVPRERRLEVRERMRVDGQVHLPLDEAEARARIVELREMGCESLLIHFLHAYANPAHELRVGEIAAELWPNDYITLGHRLLSEFREYERGTTASINAAVQPILDRYIARLRAELGEGGYGRDFLVMNGNGGTVASRLVSAEAAKTVMSGPASGVKAAAYTARAAGFADVISYDMGGTSTDVALIRGGEPEVSSELQIAYGLPVHLPMIDVKTIGAGGGSIGWIDAGGIFKVGPESAGARPGPICCGRGGTRPTVTDANMLLGRLDHEGLLAAGAVVERDHVARIFASELAGPLGLSVDEAATAMLTIANTEMAGAIRMVSLARGHDPRDFALFAFGGAGPMHANALAREMGLPRVLIPARPGMTNALGCLVADLRQDYVNTVNRPLDEVDFAELAELLAAQRRRGEAANAEERGEIVASAVRHGFDMQFVGQTHILSVRAPEGELTRESLGARFAEAYFERFAVRLPEIRAVLVNANTTVIGQREQVDLASLIDPAGRAATLDAAQKGRRPVYFDRAWIETPVFTRDRLPAGARVDGPAIIEQMDTTIVVEPGATMAMDEIGNIIVDVPLAGSERRAAE